MPAGVLFTVVDINGDIKASGLTAGIQTTTVNGQVTLSASGAAQATTVNGSIVASFANTDWVGSHSLTTVNGSIDVTIPGSANVVIHATTVHGVVSNDFPITLHNSTGFFCGTGANATGNGTIGAGGGTLDLTTVNGSIHLRKAQ